MRLSKGAPFPVFRNTEDQCHWYMSAAGGVSGENAKKIFARAGPAARA